MMESKRRVLSVAVLAMVALAATGRAYLQLHRQGSTLGMAVTPLRRGDVTVSQKARAALLKAGAGIPALRPSNNDGGQLQGKVVPQAANTRAPTKGGTNTRQRKPPSKVSADATLLGTLYPPSAKFPYNEIHARQFPAHCSSVRVLVARWTGIVTVGRRRGGGVGLGRMLRDMAGMMAFAHRLNRTLVIEGGPSRAQSASRSSRRVLLMPQDKTGSLYRCGERD